MLKIRKEQTGMLPGSRGKKKKKVENSGGDSCGGPFTLCGGRRLFRRRQRAAADGRCGGSGKRRYHVYVRDQRSDRKRSDTGIRFGS